jgi:hypothetical protein
MNASLARHRATPWIAMCLVVLGVNSAVRANPVYFRYFELEYVLGLLLASFAACLVVLWPGLRPNLQRILLGACAVIAVASLTTGLVRTQLQFNALKQECARLNTLAAAGDTNAALIARAYQCPIDRAALLRVLQARP